eukprot:maker-scaffold548_size139981-snap-gene-0.25 protein:Tk08559 transcript:maker-scaffold548_size139981-snap-gene-0.25-mRNA-1 annotation:"amidinotransferase"
MEQSPAEIVMVKPKHFAFDESTANSNAFQNKPTETGEAIKVKALAEFEAVVELFAKASVKVKVFEDTDEPMPKPDAIFPNNWFSTHSNGMVFLYPMLTKGRQAERRLDIIDYLIQTGKVKEIIDLSHNERNGMILEGTGSIVFDHSNKIGYACRSPRTSDVLFQRVCQLLGYQAVMFNAYDSMGQLVYHTNVILWIGTKAIGVCLDSITDAKEKAMVLQNLKMGHRQIMDLSHAEILGFGGNCLEIRNTQGQLLLAMSRRAFNTMRDDFRQIIRKSFHDILICDVDTIEHVGGGGIRCMIAGVHL